MSSLYDCHTTVLQNTIHMGNQIIQIWFKTSKWACQAGLESRREQSFMRFSYTGQARNFARAAFLMIFWHFCFFLVLPEAWRQSCMKTLMENATSLDSFDLQLEPGRFMFFLILYLCSDVICRSSCFFNSCLLPLLL